MRCLVTVEVAKTWLGVATSLGLFVMLGGLLQWYWSRLRWRWFEISVRTWAQEELWLDDLSEIEWKSLAAMKLGESDFSPSEVLALLDLAVLVARGQTSVALRGRVQFKAERQGE